MRHRSRAREKAAVLKAFVPKLVALGVTTFWASMMGTLVKREVLPAWTSSAPVGYASLLGSDELSRQSRMGIYLRGIRLGHADTIVQRNPKSGLDLVSRVTLSLEGLPVPILGELREIKTSLIVRVDANKAIDGFSLTIREPMFVAVNGEVIGDRLKMTTQYGDGTSSEKTVPFDASRIMSNSFSPFMGMRNLKVGKEWHVWSFNPLNRGMTQVKVTVTSKEKVTFDGETVDVFVLSAEHGPMQIKSWVTPAGEVLRQETPFGFSLRKETTEQ